MDLGNEEFAQIDRVLTSVMAKKRKTPSFLP